MGLARAVPARLRVVDSVTDLRDADRGALAVTGSHAGRYSGAVAAAAGVAAAAFNDAGVGLDRAGVAGLEVLAELGIPAWAVSHLSARIGEGAQTLCGRVGAVNESAAMLGVVCGMSGADALTAVDSAESVAATRNADQGKPDAPPAVVARGDVQRGRSICRVGELTVRVLDSASLIESRDVGAVVVTGSHGATPGSDPARAVRWPVAFAAFNDAGMGKDEAGVSRIVVLGERFIPAVAVAAVSARIGEGRSTLFDGVVSYLNRTAAACGLVAGEPLMDQLRTLSGVFAGPAAGAVERKDQR
ncbi:MAG: hypothetical protein QOJ73_2131 [Streptosporangiaceae bacterium]|jgi:hypothetical protein|nr:hypothetical protein [Streptosporangiaceae bacterium]